MYRRGLALPLVIVGLAMAGCGDEKSVTTSAGTTAIASTPADTTSTATTPTRTTSTETTSTPAPPTTTPSTQTTSTPTTSTPAATPKRASDDVSAVRRTLVAWARAATPAKACALLSARVKRGLLRSEPKACRNKKKFEAALGAELKPSTLKTTKVRVTGAKAVADTEEVTEKGVPPQKQRYHLVKEHGSWKVDSIDQSGAGSAPSS
jgi:hypothetical protein